MKKLLLLFFIFCFITKILPAQQNTNPVIYLWAGGAPGFENKKDIPEEAKDYWVKNINNPSLTVYTVPKEKATGSAVVICPGGGHRLLVYNAEGKDAAEYFNSIGVTVFVLKYRLFREENSPYTADNALQDGRRAMRMARQQASTYNVDSNRIGIMGFSAGGHLASTEGTHFDKAFIANPNNTSLRPDFMLLIYPVISFKDSIGHIGSRDNLIGKNPSAQKIIEYSNELQVNSNTPPTFLVHASDDDAVKPQNSIAFYHALLKNHVAAEMHIYESGGHGFGLNLKNKNEQWMDRCKNWMQNHGWLAQ